MVPVIVIIDNGSHNNDYWETSQALSEAVKVDRSNPPNVAIIPSAEEKTESSAFSGPTEGSQS